MIDVFFEFEQTVDRSAEEFGVSQSVSNILILFLRLDCDIIFVSLAVVVVPSYGAMEALFLPFYDVLELWFLVPRSVGDKAVLVLEGPNHLPGHIAPRKAQILEFRGNWPCGVEIGVDAGDSALVRTVQIGDSVPDLPLNCEIMLELVDDFVVLFDFCAVVVLIEF